MRISSLSLLLLSLLMLTACQSTKTVKIEADPLLLDLSFRGFEQIPIESEAEIFALNEEAREFVADVIDSDDEISKQTRSLVAAIFDRSDFNLIYSSDANTTAIDTFNRRSANCLSLSIMTYALAQEAGLEANFQEIAIPEYWTRREGFSMLNGHVNLRLSAPRKDHNYIISGRSMEVDFDPFSPKRDFPAKIVSKERIVGMFYNNKGADALVNGEFNRAYAYLRAAIKTAPDLEDAWANMGILYRMTEHYDWAENTYKQALKLNENNLTVWENLAVLHRILGRTEVAEQIAQVVAQKRLGNPYYHYHLGEQEFEANQYQLAIQHYRKAIRLDDSHHSFYFGLAKVYAALGDKKATLRNLKKAKRTSFVIDLKEQYQNKMDLFASL